MNYAEELENVNSIGEVFTLAHTLVQNELHKEQAGVLVGLADLGGSSRGFIGAFYNLVSNMIIINRRPLGKIEKTKPELYFPYLFHIVLHEYVHAVGYHVELACRQEVLKLSVKCFGEKHIVTQLAADLGKFLPDLVYPWEGFSPPEDLEIEFVPGIDRKNADYLG